MHNRYDVKRWFFTCISKTIYDNLFDYNVPCPWLNAVAHFIQWWIMLRFRLLKPELHSFQFSARARVFAHACVWESKRTGEWASEREGGCEPICNVTTFASSTLSNKLALNETNHRVHNRNSSNNVSNKNEIHFLENPKILCNFLLGRK